MAWPKGQSGNPKGRPPVGESLTGILREISEEEIHLSEYLHGKKHYTRKLLLAYYVWEGVTKGTVKFLTNGRTMKLDAKQWLSLVTWLYNRVDGTPPQSVDVTSGDEPLNSGGGVVIIIPSNGRELEDSPSTGATG